jgi:release factor glutamine methyltransferase
MAWALADACSAGIDRLDAQLLLLHALDKSAAERVWLVAHDLDALPAVAAARFTALCARRAQGEPLAYLLGRQEFFGLTLAVDARVLIPRPDTETLVNWALTLLPVAPSSAKVLDLGTGSGAVALALKHTRPSSEVLAIDASEQALCVARANALSLGLDVRMMASCWLEGVSGLFDLIVSNPPYVRATRTLPPWAMSPCRPSPPEQMASMTCARSLPKRRRTWRPAAGCCLSTATTRPAR